MVNKKNQQSTHRRKTRNVVHASDMICDHHHLPVKLRPRWMTSEDTGKKTYGGEYYCCPKYWDKFQDGSSCQYYVSGELRVPIGKVYSRD